MNPPEFLKPLQWLCIIHFLSASTLFFNLILRTFFHIVVIPITTKYETAEYYSLKICYHSYSIFMANIANIIIHLYDEKIIWNFNLID